MEKAKKKHKKLKWYQQTEALLYTYKSFKIRIMSLVQQMDMLREQLIPAGVSSARLCEGKFYTISSPVEAAVIDRLEGDAIQKLERKIKNLETMQEIVEISIDIMLDSEQKLLIDLIYNQQMSWQQICINLAIDKNTYYQRKNGIVKVLAWCFGYLPDDDAREVLGLFFDPALFSGKKTGKNRE